MAPNSCAWESIGIFGLFTGSPINKSHQILNIKGKCPMLKLVDGVVHNTNSNSTLQHFCWNLRKVLHAYVGNTSLKQDLMFHSRVKRIEFKQRNILIAHYSKSTIIQQSDNWPPVSKWVHYHLTVKCSSSIFLFFEIRVFLCSPGYPRSFYVRLDWPQTEIHLHLPLECWD